MNVLFLFIDGLGLGSCDADRNPFYRERPALLPCYENGAASRRIDHNGVLVPTDATLGVEGLPQSATGQTALFTGLNASRLLGRHLPGFPNETLRAVLRDQSILKKVKESDRRGIFINAYRPLFFKLKTATRWRLSTTTVVNLAAGNRFCSIDDIRHRRSLYHDFTNDELIKRRFPVERLTPDEAGRIMAKLSETYDFLLFEYFLTDRAGHAQDMEKGIREVQRLQAFLAGLLDEIDLRRTLVLLTSDHGNMEDLSVRSHTRNRVPTLLWGAGSEVLQSRIHSIVDIAPNVLQLLNG